MYNLLKLYSIVFKRDIRPKNWNQLLRYLKAGNPVWYYEDSDIWSPRYYINHTDREIKIQDRYGNPVGNIIKERCNFEFYVYDIYFLKRDT